MSAGAGDDGVPYTPQSEPASPNASGFFSVERDPRFSTATLGGGGLAFGAARPSPRMMRSLPGLSDRNRAAVRAAATQGGGGGGGGGSQDDAGALDFGAAADYGAATAPAPRAAQFAGGDLRFSFSASSSASPNDPGAGPAMDEDAGTATGNVPPASASSSSSSSSPRGSAQDQLEAWMRSFRHENLAAPELAQYLHQKLHEALQRSELLGRPNEFETAVCCHLLDLVCRTFGRYSALVEQLKAEIYSAIYVDREQLLAALSSGGASAKNTASTFFAFEPYFVKTKRLQAEKEALERDIETATRQRDKMHSELLKKKKVLNATAFRWQKTLKKQAFGMWGKVVQLRKQQRAMLMQYFLNRDRSRLRLVVREWKLATDESRRNKAKVLLEESRERVAEMEATRDRLDAERAETESNITQLKTDLEAARREIASLDDATMRVQQQLAESKEEELRAAAEAWAELCDIAASSQLAALRSELIGYNTDSFGDVSLLVDHPTVLTASGATVQLKTLPPFPTEEELMQLADHRKEGQKTKKQTNKKNKQHNKPAAAAAAAAGKTDGNGGGEEDDLHLDFTHPKAALELPADLIVLRWVNFHLRSAGYTKVVENLGSDLQDSEELAVVLSRCSRHCESPAVVSAKLRNVDIEARAQEIVAKCSKLGVPEHMVTVEDIVLGNADMNFALLSYLMCTAPMLQVRM